MLYSLLTSTRTRVYTRSRGNACVYTYTRQHVDRCLVQRVDMYVRRPAARVRARRGPGQHLFRCPVDSAWHTYTHTCVLGASVIQVAPTSPRWRQRHPGTRRLLVLSDQRKNANEIFECSRLVDWVWWDLSRPPRTGNATFKEGLNPGGIRVIDDDWAVFLWVNSKRLIYLCRNIADDPMSVYWRHRPTP